MPIANETMWIADNPRYISRSKGMPIYNLPSATIKIVIEKTADNRHHIHHDRSAKACTDTRYNEKRKPPALSAKAISVILGGINAGDTTSIVYTENINA